MLRKFLIIVVFFCIFSSIALATYGINVVDYPNEIIIEMGWTKYFNVLVANNGDKDLSNVTISFDGEFPQWFEVQTDKISMLQPNSNASFLVKITAPATAEQGSFSFILNVKSDETSESKSFIVRLFNTKADTMLYELQQLENEIEDIENNATRIGTYGRNVTDVMQTLNDAKNFLDASRDYINKGDYTKATDTMINAEDAIKKATYDLSMAPRNTVEVQNVDTHSELIIMLAAPIAAVVSIVYYNKKIRKKEIIVKPVVKIKEIVMEGKEVKNLENELKGVKNSKDLLEEEFKENLLSKESYDELKMKYERKIEELSAEIERNKKIV